MLTHTYKYAYSQTHDNNNIITNTLLKQEKKRKEVIKKYKPPHKPTKTYDLRKNI